MRIITKDIFLSVGGEMRSFRLTKLDAFSGVEVLRMLLRLQDKRPDEKLTVLDLVTSLTDAEMRSVMQSCLNCVSVLLPAGPNPVMTGPEWGYPELEHETMICMTLILEELSWTLEGFFGEGRTDSPPAQPNTAL